MKYDPILRAAEEVQRSSSLMKRCDLHWRHATVDHFSWAMPPRNMTTFTQRFFVCNEHWTTYGNGERGPIFFYAGNEADVTLYLNQTGLMWENALDFGAALIFAEHRYYGESLPFGPRSKEHPQFLTAEQAMADYAELILEFKREHGCQNSSVVAFGGSYGGMLAAWMRMKYPQAVDGAIASSAPILAFDGLEPPYDAGSYAKAVTYDATSKAGAAPGCSEAVRQSWDALARQGASSKDRSRLRNELNLCPDIPFQSKEDVTALALWLQSALDYIAMGNFPYASSYITNGNGVLPPFPMRVGCELMMGSGSDDIGLIQGIVKFANIFYNSTQKATCLNFRQGVNPDTDEAASLWGYQWCTEMFMPSSRGGVTDMFWPQPWNETSAVEGCQKEWGVTPRPRWAVTEWGGRKISTATNIVFANGEYDPWSGGGVLESPNPSIVSLFIPRAAHHLDLMFSHHLDTAEVKEARAIQISHIAKW
eukprot:CAMPEP_0177778850 /NCGR_PEP_ID=MMETSP0491_2-20121128/16202_1 /TAXON_ID=63592 /ORGANISM="Tetraselmis chuii, Strain PLY429" /LENGTH=478 /DNA_ID=CAMNT_0019298207 /DNA_START=295 /DNA_END=1728 /DNA_ORIENTATION=+